ncbi:NAD(P)-dependent oxidoreductase [Mycobacterium interjectum]|uniref:NAD(P)-dependent oxidoreductase n=1 Tax=Mycobacterium interjectum TaxID=33895 RepID=UPI0021F35E93|nr:NAD(P)-dependent oxidoreductase [Mycobacterium interjectum]
MDIGFIGLGNMGQGMAANLMKAGHRVTVYNRSPDKAQALVQRGATAARTVAQACRAEVVFTMLADDRAVEAVALGPDGIAASLPAGPRTCRRAPSASRCRSALPRRTPEAGQRYAAAPVFGRPEAATAAKLFVIAAGAPEVLQPLSQLFDEIGQRTFVVSEQPHTANLVKLSGNFLLASAIETIAEAVALVSKAGVDRQQYVDILTSTLFAAPAYQTYGGLIARQEFEPAGFAASLGLKDVRLVLAAGEQLQVPLPVASLLRDRFLTLVATGGGHLDWSALATLSARDAGSSDHSA